MQNLLLVVNAVVNLVAKFSVTVHSDVLGKGVFLSFVEGSTLRPEVPRGSDFIFPLFFEGFVEESTTLPWNYRSGLIPFAHDAA